MSARLAAAVAAATMTGLAQAQAMPGMPGMAMPGAAKPATAHPAHEPAATPGMPMDGTAMGAAPAQAGSAPPSGTALSAGNAPPPSPPTDHYADREFPVAGMAAARARMMHEQGGQSFHQLLFNLAEFQVRDGRDGYRWDGEGWFGGDINRVVVKSEGSGSFGGGVDGAELQALYSRAIGPYFDLQAGVRQDFAPARARTYATVGIEGLAPYMIQIEARGFVATTGRVLGRLEGWYDQRLTQRLVLQPRIELNLAAQDDPATRTGRGLVAAELGLRLRYELARRFAPYVGLSYEAETGRTAEYARADGKPARTTSLVSGVRIRF